MSMSSPDTRASTPSNVRKTVAKPAKRSAKSVSRIDRQALARAENILSDALDKKTKKARLALARKALEVSPYCAGAYNLLADNAPTPEDAGPLYLAAMEATERVLGRKAFRELEGNFWAVLETRPYMRALEGLVFCTLALGAEDHALEFGMEMLLLNPTDNQGMRYILLALLVRRDDFAGANTLLDAYIGDARCSWLYTRVLIAYRDGMADAPETAALLRVARAKNAHVPDILAGFKKAPINRTGYVTMGGMDEAADYASDFAAAWANTPGAIAWLTQAVSVATIAA